MQKDTKKSKPRLRRKGTPKQNHEVIDLPVTDWQNRKDKLENAWIDNLDKKSI